MSILVSNNQVNVKTESGFESINVLANIEGLDDLLATKADKTDTVLNTTLSMGRKADSDVGVNSTTLGIGLIASGQYSHAEGAGCVASEHASHAEGDSSVASGPHSHAEGFHTLAENNFSHAEGFFTKALNQSAHAEGSSSIASGQCAHAEGGSTMAKGDVSHSEGEFTIATGQASHAQGKFNIEDTEEKYAHIVGNGTKESARSNAHTLDWSGNAWYAGNLTLNDATITGDNIKRLTTTFAEKLTFVEGTISSTTGKAASSTPGTWLRCDYFFKAETDTFSVEQNSNIRTIVYGYSEADEDTYLNDRTTCDGTKNITVVPGRYYRVCSRIINEIGITPELCPTIKQTFFMADISRIDREIEIINRRLDSILDGTEVSY